jgi:hypothetical protein
MTKVSTPAIESILDLLRGVRAGAIDDDAATLLLRRVVLAAGSNTEDNANCLDLVDIGPGLPEPGGPIPHGLRLRGRDVMVSDVLHQAEDTEVPKVVSEALGGVTQKEWEACLRIVVHLLIACERDQADQGSRPVPG